VAVLVLGLVGGMATAGSKAGATRGESPVNVPQATTRNVLTSDLFFMTTKKSVIK
jgi:hypothetical protein